MNRAALRLTATSVSLIATILCFYALPQPATAFGCTVCWSRCPESSFEGREACNDGQCPDANWQCMGEALECEEGEELVNCWEEP